MSKRVLQVAVDCGEETCASETGQFCQHLGTVKFGTAYVCMLFPSEIRAFTMLKHKDGWLQRCTACLEAEKKSPGRRR